MIATYVEYSKIKRNLKVRIAELFVKNLMFVGDFLSV
jgi:hypothetical protein